MRCDDLVFQIDTNNNQVRYRTRATWWRSRPAHNPQRSNGAGPPCHPRTPPKAAQPTAQSPQPEKRSMAMAYEMLTSTLELHPASLCLLHTARAGKGFQPSARCAVPRFPCWMRKARSLSTRLGPARPLGHPPGRSFREPCDPPSVFFLFSFFFLEKVIHVLGSRNYHSASRSLIQANRSLGPARPPGTRRGEISEPCGPPFSLSFFLKATHWVPDLLGTCVG